MFTSIISVDFPMNNMRVKKLRYNLKRHGLGKGKVFYGVKAKTVEERNDLVFKGHYDVCKWFINNKYTPIKPHLLILEDDAYVYDTKKIKTKIKAYIRYLDKNKPDWFVLNLGCVSMSSMTHIYDNMYKGGGYGAHSYIINGNTLSKYLNIIPRDMWKAPNCVECWNMIPTENVYMIHPMLFTQDVHFSWYYHFILPGIEDSYILPYYINTINFININKFVLEIVILLGICIFVLFKF